MNNQRRKTLNEISSQIADLREQLQQVLDDEQDALDSMPENLQESERGRTAQDAISEIENAIGNLDDCEDAISNATL